MRLDHLLSREYTKSVLSDHGLEQRRNKFEFELIALYSFEGAGDSTFKRAKGRRPGSPWGCSSAGRAPALQAGGHRFEPVHLHQLLSWARKRSSRAEVSSAEGSAGVGLYGLIAQLVRAHA